MHRTVASNALTGRLLASAPGRRHGLAITAMLVLSVLPWFILSAAAASWLPTPRPLSDEELLELAVGADRSIGIVRVVGCKYDVEVDGMSMDMLDVIPIRWYSGGAGSAPLQLYSDSRVSGGFSDVAQWLAGSDSTAIVVTLKLHGRWVVLQSPVAYGGGVSPATKENKALVESRMNRVSSRLRLGGLSQRSDLVVVGRPGRLSRRCAVVGRPIICHEVQVDSIVRGVRTTEKVMMYDAAGLEPDSTTALIFLAATSTSGLYENVGFCRGRSPIENDRVRAFGNQPLSDLVRKIRAEVIAPNPPEGN